MIEAKVICDSVSPQGKRLTTFKLRYPRFIHAEFMTHRVLSRNASSSRAIPVAKMIAEVRSDAERAAPVYWGAEQKGMQSGAELSDEPIIKRPPEVTEETVLWSPRRTAQRRWEQAALSAADHAKRMVDIGLHKSIVNRILEPFLHINVVASATEWGNFFGLRLDRAAQPEMRALAVAMWEARRAGEPRLLRPGEWHLPFVDDGTREDVRLFCDGEMDELDVSGDILRQDGEGNELDRAIRVSVARCARVSYESFETGRRSTVEEDLRLYEKLLGAEPIHASPAEHQATPDEILAEGPFSFGCGTKRDGSDAPVRSARISWAHPELHGNFLGWVQHRKTLKGEAVAPLPEEFRS